MISTATRTLRGLTACVSPRNSPTVGIIGGQQQPVNQAVDERPSRQRMIEQASGPEQLLGEQRQHVDPAARRTGFDRHAGCEINLRRQLPTESIAERILNNAAVDLHT